MDVRLEELDPLGRDRRGADHPVVVPAATVRVTLEPETVDAHAPDVGGAAAAAAHPREPLRALERGGQEDAGGLGALAARDAQREHPSPVEPVAGDRVPADRPCGVEHPSVPSLDQQQARHPALLDVACQRSEDGIDPFGIGPLPRAGPEDVLQRAHGDAARAFAEPVGAGTIELVELDLAARSQDATGGIASHAAKNPGLVSYCDTQAGTLWRSRDPVSPRCSGT